MYPAYMYTGCYAASLAKGALPQGWASPISKCHRPTPKSGCCPISVESCAAGTLTEIGLINTCKNKKGDAFQAPPFYYPYQILSNLLGSPASQNSDSEESSAQQQKGCRFRDFSIQYVGARCRVRAASSLEVKSQGETKKVKLSIGVDA